MKAIHATERRKASGHKLTDVAAGAVIGAAIAGPVGAVVGGVVGNMVSRDQMGRGKGDKQGSIVGFREQPKSGDEDR